MGTDVGSSGGAGGDVGTGADVEVGPRRIGVRLADGVVAPFAVVPGEQPATISVTTAAERKIADRPPPVMIAPRSCRRGAGFTWPAL